MKSLFVLAALLYFVTLNVGCTEEPLFKKGDCIDRVQWVTESKKLNGNGYIRVTGNTVGKDFVVVECTGKGELIDGVGTLREIKCKGVETLHRDDALNYAKIECPR